jgi:hypothetical protein
MSALELFAWDVPLAPARMERLGWGMLCSIPGGVISLLGTVFWIWMLVECLTKESSEGNDKLIWALVIFFLPCVGSALYFFIRRPTRRAQLER